MISRPTHVDALAVLRRWHASHSGRCVLTAFVARGLFPAMALLAAARPCAADPCQDERFIELRNREPGELRPREQAYIDTMTRRCEAYGRLTPQGQAWQDQVARKSENLQRRSRTIATVAGAIALGMGWFFLRRAFWGEE